MSRVVIGADVGGTSTRVAVADLTGTVLAAATEPGGNPNAVGTAVSASRIRAALQQACEQARVTRAEAAVIGMAGYNTALAAGPEFLQTCLPVPVASPPRIVSDLAVAYASGSSLPHGCVVIAGTGSGAATIDHGAIVDRRGAWGWLLGDEGGGFWLGREAVRHALAEVERGTVRGDLTRQVISRLEIDTDRALEGLLRVPYQHPPIRLAELAPLITELVDSDPAAVAIAARAAEILAGLVLDLGPRPGLPIVVTGSVLGSAGPIRQAFDDRIEATLGSPVVPAGSGLVGALWLAVSQLDETLDHAPDPAVHDLLAASSSAVPDAS
jgi:N-acetylglucosamine kinase-like BadF-type ATPase